MFLLFGLHNLFILVVISSESLDQTPECADCYTLEKEEFLITDEVRMLPRAPLPSSRGLSLHYYKLATLPPPTYSLVSQQPAPIPPS